VNFLAHYVIATRFLMPSEPASAYAIGTALPDLLPRAEGRARLRPVQMERAGAQTEFEAALSAGVSVHLATDAAFHKTAAFAQAQQEVGQILGETAFEGIRVRRFFAAHVLTEMALDAVLLRGEPALADEFYNVFAAADRSAVTRWTETVTEKRLPNLTNVLVRFARSRSLRGYGIDDGVAAGFSNLCRQTGQDTFDGENFTRLVHVMSQVASRLPKYVPALLSETAAGILRVRQDF
jgi:hypothetical protein